MRKNINKIILVCLAVFLIPQIVFAAWWNPFSWFNNWTFTELIKNSDTQILEDRIKDLEQKLEQVSSTTPIKNTTVSTTSEKNLIPSAVSVPQKKQTPLPVSPSVPSIPVVTIPIQSVPKITNEIPKSFDSRCTLENNESNFFGTNNPVKASLRIWEGGNDAQSRYYSVIWKNLNGGKIKESTNKYAVFEFNKVGNYDINAEITKIATGEKQNAICSVSIYCDDYECLSLTDKKKSKLNEIIEEIDSWYDNEDVLYSCAVAESIIRALEYDYTILGGQNIPTFNKTVDCASTVAPAAYRYKIDVLKKSL